MHNVHICLGTASVDKFLLAFRFILQVKKKVVVNAIFRAALLRKQDINKTNNKQNKNVNNYIFYK